MTAADDGATDAGADPQTERVDETDVDQPAPVADPRDVAIGTADLRRSFGEVVAVDGVSLSVPQGELRAIIGPNGAGKTTLFNVITGALPPTGGEVFLGGEVVTDVAEHERPHRGLARSFQSNEMFVDQTVAENVRIVVQTARRGSFSLDLFREAATVGRERALSLIERVGLDADPETLAKNLSHGDQRRLGIAMALATDPAVLLLDEPTSGMSPGATEETAALVEAIRDDMNLTVLLIEHDMDVVLSISDRVTVLDRGRVIATGSPADVRGDDAVQQAYLGGMREEL